MGNFDGWCWYLYDIGVGILGGAMWRLYSYEWPDSCDRSALPPAALGGAGRSSAQPAQLKIQHDPQHYTKQDQLKANIIKIILSKKMFNAINDLESSLGTRYLLPSSVLAGLPG